MHLAAASGRAVRRAPRREQGERGTGPGRQAHRSGEVVRGQVCSRARGRFSPALALAGQDSVVMRAMVGCLPGKESRAVVAGQVGRLQMERETFFFGSELRGGLLTRL